MTNQTRENKRSERKNSDRDKSRCNCKNCQAKAQASKPTSISIKKLADGTIESHLEGNLKDLMWCIAAGINSISESSNISNFDLHKQLGCRLAQIDANNVVKDLASNPEKALASILNEILSSLQPKDGGQN